MSDLTRVEEVFLGALGKSDPDQCAAFLDEQCRGDAEIRRQVEQLLRAHPRAQQFLEMPPRDATHTIGFKPTAERAGTLVGGRYRLLEQIGEGGMGTVWMAQQTEPVKRTVALKLIKAGMDTKAVLARFEAERQALALMDHPNIAKVLDAGATPPSSPHEGGAVGRPFFVMELVKGVPITRYCDEQKLTVRERLALFIPVCQAVQHAHQKGVIHRDLKPSNVLIARYDDRPVPKVIDFGVAKAAGQPLTDRTLVTGFGAVVGTPEYMSPEQAQFNQLDIDTRSDIYALGVLLYELLTGSTPVTRRELETAGLLEVLRIIREQEPPRPSTRLSSSATLPEIAAARGSEPKTLTGLIRNDLDWIVMKSLEKDRNRRYETASGFATDIQRFLEGEAVHAHPPSAVYRLRKAMRKHRVAIGTAAAFAVLLVVAAGLSAFLALRARKAEDQARHALREAQKFAESASYSQGLAAGMNERLEKALEESKLTASSAQIDSDLAEIKLDRRIGLLKLARTLRALHSSGTSVPDSGELGRERRGLREFATMAALAHGQAYATLIPPISDGGGAIRLSEINSQAARLLTTGPDKTARLWDLASGEQIAMLRRKDEKVLDIGFSPDGATAFTDCSDGAVRIWEATDGKFRAQTEARPERVKNLDVDHIEDFSGSQLSLLSRTQLSDNRLLTCETSWENDARESQLDSRARRKRAVELWDARTGRFIAKLDRPPGDAVYQFIGNGRWIEGHQFVDDSKFRESNQKTVQSLHIFSAEDGRPLAELRPEANYESIQIGCVSFGGASSVSPSGRTLATVCSKWISKETINGDTTPTSTYDRFHLFVHLWDTLSWKPSSPFGPFEEHRSRFAPFLEQAKHVVGVRLLTEEIFAVSRWRWPNTGSIFRSASRSPVAQLSEAIAQVKMDRELVMLESGQLLETRNWRRVQPPKGRKYHPDLALFAPDGRLTVLSGDRDSVFFFIDSATDKVFELPRFWGTFLKQCPIYSPRMGWYGIWSDGGPLWVQRLPKLDQLDIAPELIELWAQVAVRGELDDNGSFVKWDEPTWEKKRQELTGKPVPYPDFPFPGCVATDKLYWLRAEFEDVPDADINKPRLARQLLDRADAAHDQSEANRWRKWLKP